jgi:hypothetical protein
MCQNSASSRAHRLTSGLVERTEIDMRLGPVLFEAKLTESDFQTQKAAIVEGYSDLKEVFDCRKLLRPDRQYVSCQLLRNLLAAHALTLSFCVLLDVRLPRSGRTVVQGDELCALDGSQNEVQDSNLAGAFGGFALALAVRLQRFLELKYGILS